MCSQDPFLHSDYKLLMFAEKLRDATFFFVGWDEKTVRTTCIACWEVVVQAQAST